MIRLLVGIVMLSHVHSLNFEQEKVISVEKVENKVQIGAIAEQYK